MLVGQPKKERGARERTERLHSIASSSFSGAKWFRILGVYSLFWDGYALRSQTKQLEEWDGSGSLCSSLQPNATLLLQEGNPKAPLPQPRIITAQDPTKLLVLMTQEFHHSQQLKLRGMVSSTFQSKYWNLLEGYRNLRILYQILMHQTPLWMWPSVSYAKPHLLMLRTRYCHTDKTTDNTLERIFD
jgi:hypothetical protein